MVIVYLAVLGFTFVMLGLHPLIGVLALLVAGFGWYKLAIKPRWARNAAKVRRLQGCGRGQIYA